MNILEGRKDMRFVVITTRIVFLGIILAICLNLSAGGVSAQETIPGDEQLKQLTQDTMLDFALAIKANDFTIFYKNIAQLWQAQTTNEELANIFKPFSDQNIDLTHLQGVDPIFTPPPQLDENGWLILQGYYPSQPSVTYFLLAYLEEDSGWKLVGINVDLREDSLPESEDVTAPEENEPEQPTQSALEWEQLSNEAIALYDEEQYPEALKSAQKALDIAREAFGTDHPNVADTLYNIGVFHYYLEQYAEAENFYKQALDMREKILEPEHPAIAVVLEELASVYNIQKKYAEAEPFYQRALALKENAREPDDLEVALTLSNMGGLYNSLGKYAEAESFHRRALLIRENALGSDHPDLAGSLNNLGEWHDLQDRHIEAELLYRRALAIVENALDSNDPVVTTISENLANLYKKTGRAKEAEKFTAVSGNPLLRLLRFIPDTPEYREYLSYGDAAAWHRSWNIPRIDSLDELENLDRESRAYWNFIMLSQTIPPDSLGFRHLWVEDQRGFYGFDRFNLDRFIGAGQLPDWLTVAEFKLDKTSIANALTASGYNAEELETGGTLYSILRDYQLSFKFPMRSGQLGNLNRIALLDGQMVIAKATAIVTNALLTNNGKHPSLADSPDYIAAVKALEHPALKDTGELAGAIFTTAPNVYDPMLLLEPFAKEEVLQQLKAYAQKPLLPPYSLVAFATRHTQGASYLILTVVFPKGTDANIAADILADRLQNYVSADKGTSLDDRWTFEKAFGIEVQGLPLTLAVMRVDDPPPTPENADRVNADVFTWSALFFSRDTLFLITGGIPVLPGE